MRKNRMRQGQELVVHMLKKYPECLFDDPSSTMAPKKGTGGGTARAIQSHIRDVPV